MRSRATAAPTVQRTTRTAARSASGPRPGRQRWSWNAASATTVTPAPRRRPSTSKKVVSVCHERWSPRLGVKPGLAWTMPSLISSRQIAGQPTARARWCASVVLPDPAGPLTTMRVGDGTPRSWHVSSRMLASTQAAGRRPRGAPRGRRRLRSVQPPGERLDLEALPAHPQPGALDLDARARLPLRFAGRAPGQLRLVQGAVGRHRDRARVAELLVPAGQVLLQPLQCPADLLGSAGEVVRGAPWRVPHPPLDALHTGRR